MRFEFHRFIGPLFRCVGGFKLKTAVGATVFSRGRFPRFFCFGPQPFQMISLISCHLIHLSGAGGRPHSANYRIVTFKSVPLLSLRLFSAFHFIFESGGREGGGERWGGAGVSWISSKFIRLIDWNCIRVDSAARLGFAAFFSCSFFFHCCCCCCCCWKWKLSVWKKKTKKYKKQNRTKQNKTEKQNGWRWDEKDSDTIMNAVPNWFPGVGVTITNGNNEPNSLQSSS